ncbi:anthrone oxygenase family protein [Pseudonocardia adelaidensis]|uniref:DUF1772 domain-containing protein n=1 Tax=Pseudonocardia adelaidensis TaxID=648754 RepID=A0ABP9NB27_9PSEU
MRPRSAKLVTLLLATVTTGLIAGVFGDWAVTIMPGLHATDDRTFVAAFQALDHAIYNAPFMLAFTGALAFTGVAAVLHGRGGSRSPLPWVAVAFGLYVVAFVITVVVNVPLNDGLVAAGLPDRIADLAAVRAAFDESRWITWHAVRTIATVAAFACLVWALVLHGRATAGREAPSPAGAAHR